MMICPNCHITYPDDDIFCMKDGSTLIAESGEQETEVRTAFNPADNEFSPPKPIQYEQSESPPASETIAFAPPVFNSPIQQSPIEPSSNKNVLITVLAALSVILAFTVLYMLNGGQQPTIDNDQSAKISNDQSSNISNDNNSDETEDKAKRNGTKDVSGNLAFTDEKKVQPGLPENFDRVYKGYSNRSLTLSLKRNGNYLSGTAVTPGDWDDLQGSIDSDGNFDLAGNNRGSGVTGHWRGRIDQRGTARGVWTGISGRRVPFKTTLVR